jgi:helicase MOV-10
VKLVKNFRSHQAILHYPNLQFYVSDLLECGPRTIIDSYLNWPKLLSPKFPVVFHSIIGKDDRESSSPSYFNIDEITQVKAYVQDLLTNVNFPVGKSNSSLVILISSY